MRRLFIFFSLGLVSSAMATDHNNLEKGRPLRFDDAYSIAYRAFEFQNGFKWETLSGVYSFHSEFQYGFNNNKDISVAVEPTVDAADGMTRLTVAELSYFESLRREVGNASALGYRVDVGLPVDGSQRGVETRLRGILTKSLHQYDKFHVNVDVNHRTSPKGGERSTTVGAILGYSSPVGYPRHFDTTLLAEFGVEQSKLDEGGAHGWVGIGFRRQISAVTSMDFGIQSDVFAAKRVSRSPLGVTVGYSFSF
jgi:hypothetical protein